MGTKNDGIQRIVKGYVYLGGYVLNYLLKVTGGMLITKGTFIWHNIVLVDGLPFSDIDFRFYLQNMIYLCHYLPILPK